MFKTDFAFLNQQPGYITDYVRRFWNSSTDHRGTPEAPGRVVTLLKNDEWIKYKDPHSAPRQVWGIVYEIDEKERESVLKYLDYREKEGYSLEFIDVVVKGQTLNNCGVYRATSQDSSFMGPPDEFEDLAALIAGAHGPSGANSTYLFHLASAVRLLQSDDDHLNALEESVRKIMLLRIQN